MVGLGLSTKLQKLPNLPKLLSCCWTEARWETAETAETAETVEQIWQIQKRLEKLLLADAILMQMDAL